jgi:3',5'-nucleoside bisphosphate phosphatase
METRADLHIHTTASDGALSPTQVVEAAADLGLAAIAITDHDTVAGVDEALAAGERLGVEVVPGVEISTVHDRAEAHIIGYFIDHHNAAFVERLDVLRNARWERGKEMVEKLNAAGVPIVFERVAELADGGAIGRPHVARAICEIGAVHSMDSAFGKYLVEGCPGFVPRYKVTPFEAVQMIIDAGGVPCCGHVAKLKDDELVRQMIEAGLKAVEIYHPDHGPASVRFYRKFAAKHGLIATGGSDAHGFPGSAGTAIGSVSAPYEVVEQLRNAMKG